MGALSNFIELPILLVSMTRLPQPGSELSDRILVLQEKVLQWLKCGIAPRQLAFTLALGFAIGCIPLLGVTTGICALFAILLRLNMPAIQAANWLAMPLQVVLLIPFLRLACSRANGQYFWTRAACVAADGRASAASNDVIAHAPDAKGFETGGR